MGHWVKLDVVEARHGWWIKPAAWAVGAALGAWLWLWPILGGIRMLSGG